MKENVKGEKGMDFTKKCFVMMPISNQGNYPEGHFTKVYEQIFKPDIEKAGYEPYRVDENSISDSIIGKIFEAIQECQMALCDLSNRNPNVLYELGIRQAYDKPVVLVQDDKTERIFDVSGISTVQYKSNRLYEEVMAAREKIIRAITETKSGKRNSIIKIVKAQTAEISTDDISKEDKIEIMIAGLVEDIKELKDNRGAYSKRELDNIRFFPSPEKHIYSTGETAATSQAQRVDVLSRIFVKDGITNKEIKKLIQEMELLFGRTIFFERKGHLLYLKFDENTSNFTAESITERIKDRIGK